ncbi:MAG: 4-(cytidine 5'-diphospho)-2-C-methyl-D-erythritol kinase [Proteobacteria bacterium]|nr:4-(cytidine 5'-diphospho)-2-C-methyl-D-erythritol kinase [Pseudomonadota bacterium]
MFFSLCPAKINLFLKITGKRSDGYHELESLFAFLDLSDELFVKKGDQFKLEISGEFADKIDLKNNLFVKILDFFASEFQISKNLEIKIIKNIPVAAGLGGGSSDAAYFLHALNKIFTLNLSLAELQKISLNFGSDIAFLLQNKAAIVRGRGEKITEFPAFKEISALLINPKIAVSTKEIFTNFDSNFSAKTSDEALLKKDVFDLIKNFPNDMEKPAKSSFPIIAEILQELKNHKSEIAKMSGSGATCFAIFKNEKTLQSTQDFFTKNFSNYFVKKVKILGEVSKKISLQKAL